MARSTIHFAVPDAVRRFVDERVKAEGYKTVSEYLRLLIREDRQRL